MAKEKFTLKELEVKSFVSSLENDSLKELKGGYQFKGRRYTYRVRWTSVDTRVESAVGINPLRNSKV